jgi:DNA repair protein RadC
MAITDWPEAERPRERLLRDGADALSDAELLAVFLRVGMRGKSAVDLARDLLARFDGNLTALCEAGIGELATVSGIGPAKAAQLKAIFSLSRRALAQGFRERDVLASPEAVRDFLQLKLAAQAREIFLVLLLDVRNRLIDAVELFRGTLDQTTVHPREVCRLALLNNAASVIVAHNHPAGSREASAADLAVTSQLKTALSVIEVRLLDHFIVAPGHRPLSLAEGGLL